MKFEDMTKEQLQTAESMIRLNQLKVGDFIDERLEKDLRNLTGPRIQMQSLKVIFDKNGAAHTLNDDIISDVKIDGKSVLAKPVKT